MPEDINTDHGVSEELIKVKSALNLLKETVCFIIFHFSDGSSMFTVTTLNTEILKEFGAEICPDSFFDLLKCKSVKFRKDAVSIEVSTDIKGVREVDLFANKYV